MSSGFDFLESADPGTAARVLSAETPLLAAVVLSRTSPATAAKILANMGGDRQREVTAKLSKARSAPADVAARVAAVVQKRLAGESQLKTAGGASASRSGPQAWKPRQAPGAAAVNLPAPKKPALAEASPPPARAAAVGRGAREPQVAPAASGKARPVDGALLAAQILRYAPRKVRDLVRQSEPTLYASLRRRMFSFDDLTSAPDAMLAQVFATVEPATAGLALRFADPVLTRRALQAMSPRRAEMIQDEIEVSAQGRVRLCDVEQAQDQVLEAALQLQSAGRGLIDPNDPDAVR